MCILTEKLAQRLHVKIYDAEERVYQVPEDVIPRPSSNSVDDCDLDFNLQEDSFSFSVSRKSTGEVLFDTTGTSLVFESEYLRLRTSLPTNPNLYGKYIQLLLVNCACAFRCYLAREKLTVTLHHRFGRER